MGALPKNKITRAERGKRRSGNTPSLKKEAKHSKVPRHKQGLLDQVLQSLGIKASQTDTTKTNKKTVKKEASQKQINLARESRKMNPAAQANTATRTVRKTPQKKEA